MIGPLVLVKFIQMNKKKHHAVSKMSHSALSSHLDRIIVLNVISMHDIYNMRISIFTKQNLHLFKSNNKS